MKSWLEKERGDLLSTSTGKAHGRAGNKRVRDTIPAKSYLTFAFSLGSMTMPLVELFSSLETTQRNSA